MDIACVSTCTCTMLESSANVQEIRSHTFITKRYSKRNIPGLYSCEGNTL